MEKIDIKLNDIEFSISKDERVWGDGKHESTKNIMQLISKYGVKDKSVIDVGTGTGILSILCAKLGAKNILALDIDLTSIDCARTNCQRNNVNVIVELGDITHYINDKADVILSNLPAAAQIRNVKTVKKNLKDNSLFIISWFNKMNFKNHVHGFEILEHIPGNEFDVYVLKKTINELPVTM